VTRRRSLDLLAYGRDSHVLIVAPGGSGKSTLAAQLASAADSAAWASPAPADNEPGCFWTAALIAFRTALPDFGDDLLAEVIGGSDVDRLLVRMPDRLMAAGRPVPLILDDLHDITDDVILRQIDWLLDRLDPTTCRIVMCSRSRPTLATAQLVMTGRLIVLETGDVSFDDADCSWKNWASPSARKNRTRSPPVPMADRPPSICAGCRCALAYQSGR